jgi:hypothetical protein
MANVKNFGAEIIGKAIVIGETTSKYVVVSVNGDNVQTKFYRSEDSEPLSVPMTTQILSMMLATGKWHWEGTASDVSDAEDEVEEVDAEDVEEPETAPKPEPKKKPVAKKKTTPKSAPKSEPKKGQYVYAEYTTKMGKTAPKIMGFNENDYIYLNAASVGGAKSWEWIKVNGKKMKAYTVIFGTRWCDLAHQLVDALNNGASKDELLEIAETAKEAADTARAAQKEEYLEKKAKRQAERDAETSAKSAKSAAKTAAGNNEKLYTEAEVKARIRKAFKCLADAMHVDVKSLEPIIAAA